MFGIFDDWDRHITRQCDRLWSKIANFKLRFSIIVRCSKAGPPDNSGKCSATTLTTRLVPAGRACEAV
jgi:hypothetical protein